MIDNRATNCYQIKIFILIPISLNLVYIGEYIIKNSWMKLFFKFFNKFYITNREPTQHFAISAQYVALLTQHVVPTKTTALFSQLTLMR